MAKFELFGTSRRQHTSDVREWLEMRCADIDEYDVGSDLDARRRMRAYVGALRTSPVLI